MKSIFKSFFERRLINSPFTIMKSITGFFLVSISVIILCSCSERKDGDWDDIIKLSTKAVGFSASADSVIITTKGGWWWITDVSVNEKNYYGFANIDLESDTYSIKQDCFVVERRNKNTLFIKVLENPLSIQRRITVGLEAGDYFDRVTITQAAK